MKFQLFRQGDLRRIVSLLLTALMATAPSASVVAQSLGATQSVRGRGLSLAPTPESPPPEPPAPPETSPAGEPYSPSATVGKLDTTYVSSTAAAIVVLRPAQLTASPTFQMFPVEVASAAGLQYLGVDPVDIDEVVAFLDMSNPLAPAYGVTIKFNKPFRAIAIPMERRAHAQLSELNGKKYLKSAHPLLPSFYGPNNKTLVLAPDAVMEKLVMEAGQPKSGTLLDRTRDVPSGSDLFVAVDMVPLRPLVQMQMARAQAKIPPEAQQFAEAINLISAVELTLNLAAVGPSSFVIHGNDESAAEQLELIVQGAMNKMQSSAGGEQTPTDDPIQQALARYKERVSRPFQPVRNGVNVTCMQIDGQDPAQRQMTSVAVIGVLVALLLPAIQAAREAARRAQAQNEARMGMPPDGSAPDSAEGAPEGAPAQEERPAGSRGSEPIGLPGGVVIPPG